MEPLPASDDRRALSEPRTLPPGSDAECKGAGVFATTRWSVVLGAAHDSEGGRAALEWLCRTYWFPVYALVRRQGFDPDTARDFTQDFFAHLLRNDGLTRVRPERGRFRSFLSQSVRNFLADAWDRSRAQKRGGGAEHVSIEAEAAEGRFLGGLEHASPDRLFDRAWAEQLLSQSRERLSEEWRANGLESILGILERAGDRTAPGLAEEAARLGMPLNTLKSHLHRARRRQAELVRELIAETVESPMDIEDELQHLMRVLAG
ncbi:MAG: sigma-70 family RNA polymerase sigma factor [Verrucomicrobiales bacterium]|nr:sigma-70 family RNA polymerase sigma factor [Verrucomicrobiales bacterium]